MATLSLLKHIVLGGDSAVQLMDVLGQGSREDINWVFSGIIRVWLDCIAIQIQTGYDDRRGLHELRGDSMPSIFAGGLPPVRTEQGLSETWRFGEKMVGVDNYLYNLLKFTIKAAGRQTSIRLGIVDAGGLVLVLTAFANAEFPLSSLVTITKEGGVTTSTRLDGTKVSNEGLLSPAKINTEALALSGLIRSPKFTKPWKGERMEARLSLCSLFVDTLLKDDKEYGVTRGLFKKIFAAVDS
jgi:hypothetical protein